MKIQDHSLEEILLFSGMIILNIISAYTTQVGYASSLNDSASKFMSIFVPWGIAIVLSIFLIVFSLQLMKDGLRKTPIIGYLFVAMISIFFNFNALYTEASSISNQSAYNNKVIQNFNTLAMFSITQLEKKIQPLNIELSTLKEVADFEGSLLKGGCKTKCIKKTAIFRNKKAEYTPVIKDYNKHIHYIRDLQVKEQNISSTLKGKEKEREILKVFSDLDIYSKDLKVHNNKDYFKDQDEYDRASLEYSLHILSTTFSDIFQGKENTANTYKVLYSLFFSALIDLLMFFVLIFNAKSKKRTINLS